jgi:hypothetical protein
MSVRLSGVPLRVPRCGTQAAERSCPSGLGPASAKVPAGTTFRTGGRGARSWPVRGNERRRTAVPPPRLKQKQLLLFQSAS